MGGDAQIVPSMLVQRILFPFSTSVSPDLSDYVCISKIDHSMSHKKTGQKICGKENAVLASHAFCIIAPSHQIKDGSFSTKLNLSIAIVSFYRPQLFKRQIAPCNG